MKLFEFKWEKGSINDNVIEYCKEQGIEFRYNQYFNLELNIEKLGIWFKPDYKVKDGIAAIYI